MIVPTLHDTMRTVAVVPVVLGIIIRNNDQVVLACVAEGAPPWFPPVGPILFTPSSSSF